MYKDKEKNDLNVFFKKHKNLYQTISSHKIYFHYKKNQFSAKFFYQSERIKYFLPSMYEVTCI